MTQEALHALQVRTLVVTGAANTAWPSVSAGSAEFAVAAWTAAERLDAPAQVERRNHLQNLVARPHFSNLKGMPAAGGWGVKGQQNTVEGRNPADGLAPCEITA